MINVISPINQLGYGIVGLNIVKSLHELMDISLWPIGQPSVTSQEDANLVSGLIDSGQLPDFDAPCLRIWHQHDMSQFVGRGLRVGMPIFELDDFNRVEKHHLSNLDRVVVCSEWAKQVVYDTIKHNNIHVVQLGVDTDIFKPCETLEGSTTTFFNCGKWEVRKGHDILFKAFDEAFSLDDDVELWMMCQNPFNSESEEEEWRNLYKGAKMGSKIKLIDRVESQEEVYNIMSKADCGVFPSRGEGWNLELLEMMACGKNVIATNYSAHTEFCNEDNSILIECQETEPAYDGKWFHGKCGSWAKVGEKQITDLSDAMRDIFEQKTNGRLSVNTQGIKTAKSLSWNSTALKILESLK
jgi:glycosyltransferase involved in cell wall biosynthesis